MLIPDEIKNKKILVIGDSILDKYFIGEVHKISSEAPVPINHVLTTCNKLGGAANVANNLKTLGSQVSILTHIGDDDNGKLLSSLFTDINVIPIITSNQTTTKIRVLGDRQQMLRLDFEDELLLSSEQEQQIFKRLEDLIEEQDAVIISDYGKGFCNYDVCRWTITLCKKANKLIVVDPKGINWDKYIGVNYITPNFKEFNDVLFVKIKDDSKQIERAAKNITSKFKLEGLLITRSEKGISLINKEIIHLPAFNKQSVFDCTGAGDTVVATFTLAKLLNLNNRQCAYLASIAASISVMQIGTYAPTVQEIFEALKKEKDHSDNE